MVVPAMCGPGAGGSGRGGLLLRSRLVRPCQAGLDERWEELRSTYARRAPSFLATVLPGLAPLVDAVGGFVRDPLWARQVGKAARAAALGRYSLSRFLRDWGRLLAEVTR